MEPIAQKSEKSDPSPPMSAPKSQILAPLLLFFVIYDYYYYYHDIILRFSLYSHGRLRLRTCGLSINVFRTIRAILL